MPSNPNRAPSHTPAARALLRARASLHDAGRRLFAHHSNTEGSATRAPIRLYESVACENPNCRDCPPTINLERAALRYAAAVARAAAEGAKR